MDPQGLLLHEWEQLEVANPAWSGFELDTSGVSWRDDTTDDVAVTFTLLQWSALLEPLGLLEYDLLFSPDGRTWEILETFTTRPNVLAIGDDDIVVSEHISLQYTFVGTNVSSLPVESPG